MNRFRGIVVPMLTPLTADGRIDQRALSPCLDFLASNGANALFALSSTGEFCAMPWRRQCELVESTMVHNAGRLPVWAGVSTQCLEHLPCTRWGDVRRRIFGRSITLRRRRCFD